MNTKEYDELVMYAKGLILNRNIPLDANDLVGEAFLVNQNLTRDQFKKEIKKKYYEYKNQFHSHEIIEYKIKQSRRLIETFKVCKICTDECPIALFKIHKTYNSVGDVIGNICKKCRNKRALIRYHKNKAYIRSYRNTPKYRDKKREYYFKNHQRQLECHRAVSKKSDKKQRDKLADSYIKRLLRAEGFKNNEITPRLISKRRIKCIFNRQKRGGINI